MEGRPENATLMVLTRREIAKFIYNYIVPWCSRRFAWSATLVRCSIRALETIIYSLLYSMYSSLLIKGIWQVIQKSFNRKQIVNVRGHKGKHASKQRKSRKRNHHHHPICSIAVHHEEHGHPAYQGVNKEIRRNLG